jgi:hypothetical protein
MPIIADGADGVLWHHAYQLEAVAYRRHILFEPLGAYMTLEEDDGF